MSDVKERIYHFWGETDLFKIPLADAEAMGFSKNDACLLENPGFPNWAAPNLYFYSPKESGDEGIFIGEDRDDLPIIYDKDTCRIFIQLMDDCMILVAMNLRNLLDILTEYAYMIDRAIFENGDRAFSDNNVPNYLIDAFEKFVKNMFDGVNSVWSKEVHRLRSHVLD